MRDFSSKRKDLTLPCGRCAKKFPGCPDTCTDEEFLTVKANIAKLKDYRRNEDAMRRYEADHRYRCEEARKKHGKWSAQ